MIAPMDTTGRVYARHLGLVAPMVCPDCGALVADTPQHDRWHLALSTSGHVPVVRGDGTIVVE